MVEYKIARVGTASDPTGPASEVLTHFAREGWEVVTMGIDAGSSAFFFTLRRDSSPG